VFARGFLIVGPGGICWEKQRPANARHMNKLNSDFIR
jgi:hypothetical protein